MLVGMLCKLVLLLRCSLLTICMGKTDSSHIRSKTLAVVIYLLWFQLASQAVTGSGVMANGRSVDDSDDEVILY